MQLPKFEYLELKTVEEACRKAEITMFGCQAWIDLPGIKGKLPQGVVTIEKEDVPQRVANAKTIFGSF